MSRSTRQIELGDEESRPGEHGRTRHGRVADLRQRLLAESDRIRGLAVVVADGRSEAQRHRPRGPFRAAAIARRGSRRPGRSPRRPRTGTPRPSIARRMASSGELLGCELARPFVERCGVEGGTSVPGVGGGRLERCGDRLVAAFRRAAEVAGSRIVGCGGWASTAWASCISAGVARRSRPAPGADA